MTKKKQKPEPVKELAYWTEDASGIWHFLLGGIGGRTLSEIHKDKSRKAPKVQWKARWFKDGKIGGTIVGPDLAALKIKVLEGYIKDASTPEIRRLLSAMANHFTIRADAFDTAAARWRQYAERHERIRIFAEIEEAIRRKQ